MLMNRFGISFSIHQSRCKLHGLFAEFLIQGNIHLVCLQDDGIGIGRFLLLQKRFHSFVDTPSHWRLEVACLYHTADPGEVIIRVHKKCCR